MNRAARNTAFTLAALSICTGLGACSTMRGVTGRDGFNYSTSQAPKPHAANTASSLTSTKPERQLMIAGDPLGQQIFVDQPTPAQPDSAFANVPND